MAGPEDAGSLFQRLKDLVNQLLPKDRPTPPPAGPGGEEHIDLSKLGDVAGKLGEVEALRQRTLESDERYCAEQLEKWYMRTHEEGVNATEILRALASQNDLSIAYSNAAAAALRAAVAVFVYHREAPAKLQAEYRLWLEASKILNRIAKSLPSMEKVPGWSGPAADEYTEMAGVQTQASLELAGLTTVVLETYRLAIQVNVTMQAAAYEYLCQVVERAEADNYTPSAPECYGPTKRLTQLMANAMDEICALEGKIGQTQQHLNEDITAAQNALRVYVDSIWPHGTAKAGVKAGNILGLRPTPPMDISDKLDDPDAQGNLRRNR